MSALHALVLEDDHQLRGLLRRGLEEAGFRTTGAATAADALAAVETAPPDLIVVDIGLPDADGRDVVQALRAAGHDMPVLFLTARDSLADRLSGFSAGGDDYLTKPFAIAEVVARLRALGRRSAAPPPEGPGGLVLDPGRHDAAVDGVGVQLTPTEFRILARLAAEPGTNVRRQDLIDAAWPHGAVVHANTLDVYVARIRRKLAELPGELQIHTAHGIGYTLR